MKRIYVPCFLLVLGLMLGACTPNQLPILPPGTEEAAMEAEAATEEAAAEEEAIDEAAEDNAVATDEAAEEEVADDDVAEEAVEDDAVATDEASEEEATEGATEDEAADEEVVDGDAAEEAVEDDAVATDEAAEEETAEETVADDTEEAVEDDAMGGGDLMDALIDAGNFSTLVTAIQEADLYTTLEQEGPLTLFAPTDDAFAALPEGAVATLLSDPEGILTDILLYHVVDGTVMAADVVELDDEYVMTLAETTFQVVLDGDNVTLYDGADNTINVTEVDIEASNGVVHVIDAVLMPDPDMIAAEAMEAGPTEAEATEETTEEATEEAAADDGAEEAVEDVAADDTAATDEATEEAATDEAADDGTEEATEEVAADDTTAATDEATEEVAEESVGDIVDVVIAQGNLSLAVTAIQEADLLSTFEQEGPLTVFVPTDDAFAALPAGVLDALLADPQGMLTDILLYHVVEGKVMAADVVGLDGQDVTTLSDATFSVLLDGGSVTLYDGAGNTVYVTMTDLEASNGVVHVIDAILMPQ